MSWSNCSWQHARGKKKDEKGLRGSTETKTGTKVFGHGISRKGGGGGLLLGSLTRSER